MQRRCLAPAMKGITPAIPLSMFPLPFPAKTTLSPSTIQKTIPQTAATPGLHGIQPCFSESDNLQIAITASRNTPIAPPMKSTDE